MNLCNSQTASLEESVQLTVRFDFEYNYVEQLYFCEFMEL